MLPRLAPHPPAVRIFFSDTFPIARVADETPDKAPENPFGGHVGLGGAHKQWLVPCIALVQGMCKPGDPRTHAGRGGSWPQGIYEPLGQW